MGNGEDSGSASGPSAGRGTKWLIGCLGVLRSFSCGRGLCGSRGRTNRGAGVRFFHDSNEILIRDFPAEMFVLAALLEILFEEDGTAGVRDENAGGGQNDIGGAVLHLHTTPEKRRVASHPVLSF